MKPLINYSVTTFLSDVQQLEFTRKLLLRKGDFYARITLILSDNLVEMLICRLLKVQMASDSELISIIEPQIPQDEIDRINRYYDQKVKWLIRLKFIDSVMAERIRFVHFYRNLSYHADTKNFACEAIASLAFANALAVFKYFYAVNNVHRSAVAPLLKKYSLPTNRIDYPFASNIISNKLRKTVVNMSTIISKLKNNLKERLEAISVKRVELSWLKPDFIFDAWLRVYEYFEKNPYNSLLKNVYKVNYELIKLLRSNKAKAHALWRKLKLKESTRDRRIQRSLDQYKPLVSSHSLKLVGGFIKQDIKNLESFLQMYRDLDIKLRNIEGLISKIEMDFEREVQREIDRRRGK